MKKQDISEIPTMLHAAVRPLFRPFTMPTKQSAEQYRQNTGINEEVMQIPIPISQSTSPPSQQLGGQFIQNTGRKEERKQLSLPTRQSISSPSHQLSGQYRQNAGFNGERMQLPIPTSQSISSPSQQSVGLYRQNTGMNGERMQTPIPTSQSTSPPSQQPVGMYRQNMGMNGEMMQLPLPIRQSTSPPINPAKPMRKHRNYRHALYICACQLLYTSIAVALGSLAYWYFAAWPVYRVVAFVVIIIAWSNIASATARKKSVDMLATVKVQAIRLGDRKMSSHMDSPALTQDTTTYLRAIKASLLREKP